MNDAVPLHEGSTDGGQDSSVVGSHASATIIDVLRFRAAHQPETEVFRMLDRHADITDVLTYRDLDERCRSLAAVLAASEQRGKPVLICLPASLDYIVAFFGCLYAGAIAVPLLPPDPVTSPGGTRVVAVAADTAAEVAIGSSRVIQAATDVGFGDLLTWVDVESIAATPVPEPVTAAPADVAFLQYTSGSTNSPKGVMITHQALMANLQAIHTASVPDQMIGVSWLPFFHDMGLISAVVAPVYSNGTQYLMSPTSFLRDPLAWPLALSRYHATVSAGPDFGYSRCAEVASEDPRVADLDLSRIETMLTGSEPVRIETLDAFCEAFAPAGFRRSAFQPCLGMSELTVMATAQRRGVEPRSLRVSRHGLAERVISVVDSTVDGRILVSNGPVIEGHEVVVVASDGGTVALGENEFGEICIAGPSLAAGYWERPDATNAAFGRHIAGSDKRWYATGDGGFLNDSEVYVTGRLAELVIVRGQNHAPEDIEASVTNCHDAIASAAVLQISDDQELAVIVGTARRASYDEPELRSAVVTVLSQRHGLAADHLVIVKDRSIPRTSSGKVQRHRCASLVVGAVQAAGTAAESLPEVGEPASSAVPAELDSALNVKRNEIAHWLTNRVAAAARVSSETVSWHAPYDSLGLDSAAMLTVLGELERFIGQPVPETLMLEHPCISATLDALTGKVETRTGADERPASPENRPQSDGACDIAIVGMSCRVPGAADTEALWSLLSDRRCATGSGVDRSAVWSGARPELSGLAGLGGFIENVERFDHLFFRMGDVEASLTDPQQRLALELAFEAIEDAGADMTVLASQTVGVFVGVSANDFAELSVSEGSPLVAVGNAHSIVANRISYAFGFGGPSMAIDTACSSSAVAIHQASLALRNGDCDLALVGGVNIVLVPTVGKSFEQAGLLSPDGYSKAFDARADGFVRSEGGAFVLLRRAEDALAAGDRTYASIIGSAVNNDGRSNGILAPNGAAQVDVIQRAHRNSGIVADDVVYIEAHGTGTALGDAVESAALRRVFEPRDIEPVIVGSAKANVGHLEAAAGIVGVVKTALALHHGIMPATPHTREPIADFGPETPLALATNRRSFVDSGRPNVAGVSSFGFGGTNAHVVLQSVARVDSRLVSEQPDRSVQLLVVSAASPSALRAQAERLRHRASNATADETVGDLCRSLARRNLLDVRAVATVSSWAEVDDALDAIARGESHQTVQLSTKRLQAKPRVIAVFSGSGGSWPGMGTTLYRTEPVFRASLDASSDVVAAEYGWSISELIAEGLGESMSKQTATVQPVSTAIQIALWDLLRHWGIEAAGIVGHSYGEVAAGYAAGGLDRATAMRVCVERALHLGAHDGDGSMVVVDCGEDAARTLLDGRSDVFIAAVNDPGHTVLSGCEGGLAAVATAAAEYGYRCRPVQISVGAHTPLLADAAAALKHRLEGMTPSAPSIPLWSTVTAEPSERLDATYWEQNLLQPVRFSDTIAAILADGPCEFIEISTHPILGFSVAETARELGTKTSHTATMRRNGTDVEMLESIATLFSLGVPCDMRRVSREQGHALDLPTYAWQRVECWIKPAPRELTMSSEGFDAGQPEAVGSAYFACSTWKRDETGLMADQSAGSSRWLVTGATPCAKATAERLMTLGTDAQFSANHDLAPDAFDRVIHFVASPSSVASLTDECLRIVSIMTKLKNAVGDRRLWLVTRDAVQPTESGAVDPWQSALAGFARSLALEEASIVAGQVDVGLVDAFDVNGLVELLLSSSPPVESAIRDTGRYLPTIIPITPPGARRPLVVDSTRPILITGGLGGLGLAVARDHAVTVGSPIILVGRRLPEEVEVDRPGTVQSIESLRELGVQVIVACVDLANRRDAVDELSAVLDALPSVQTIYHLAGTSTVQEWDQLDRAAIDRALAAKVNGALSLHELFGDQPDCEIVHFSSISAAWGSEFLAPYAAANAFLDGLALSASPGGPTTRSLQWGPWNSVGMASRAGTAEMLADIGIRAYEPAEALDVLAMSRTVTVPTVVCADIDWEMLHRLRQLGRPGDNRFAPMGSRGPTTTPVSSSLPAAVPPAVTTAADPSAVARASWGSVLGLDEIPPEMGFLDLGGDSLRAVQVIRRVSEACGIEVPIEALFDATSFDDFCEIAGIGVARQASTQDGRTPRLSTETSDQDSLPAAGLEQVLTETWYPLSAVQRRIWFHEQLEPGSPAYHIPIGLDIDGDLDVDRLRHAATHVVRRHGALRSSIVESGGEVSQRCSATAAVDFTVFDLDGSGTYGDRDEFLIGEAMRPFDLENGPMLRVSVARGEQGLVVMLNVHHIVADGWSLGVLLTDLAALYLDPEAELLSPSTTYRDHVEWERSIEAGAEVAADLDYWRSHLDGVSPVIDLPLEWARNSGGRQGHTLQRVLDASQLAKIDQTAGEQRASRFAVIAAAFSVVLGRLCSTDDVVFGTPVVGRRSIADEAVVGCYVNTVPIRVKVDEGERFADLVDQLRTLTTNAFKHSAVPFDRLVHELGIERHPGRPPLVQAMLTMENMPIPAMRLGDVAIEPIIVNTGAPKFDLEVLVSEESDGLRICLEYDGAILGENTMKGLLDALTEAMVGWVATPETTLGDLSLVSPAEQRRAFTAGHSPEPCDVDISFCEIFDAQVAKDPDAIAVTDGDGNSYSYTELQRRSRSLAAAMTDRGATSGCRVALHTRRNAEYLVALIAVLRTGAAFVPLDLSTTLLRRAQLLRLCDVDLIVVDDPLAAELIDALRHGSEAVVWSHDTGTAQLPEPADPNSPAYVLFTSGSTGEPKGATVKHRGMVNHLRSKVEDLDIVAADIVAETARTSFDISIWQFLAALMAGATTAVLGEEAATDPTDLIDQLAASKITVWEAVPTVLSRVLDRLDSRGQRLDGVRIGLATGEALPPSLARRWFDHFEVPLVNAYGPTECSDDVTHHVLRAPPSDATLHMPIGLPIRGVDIYILDPHLRPVPSGFVGELVVGGVAVGAGYLDDDEQTRRAFVSLPHYSEAGTCYRTGDRVRRRADGTIEFIGRQDQQVKIRGARIEPGEVEAVLASAPGLAAAAVMAWKRADEGYVLCGYALPKDGSEVTTTELRQYIAARLPAAAVPTYWIVLDEMPLNTAGKIDRDRLPEPSYESNSHPHRVAAGDTFGRDVLADMVMAAWHDLVGSRVIDRYIDIFESGGDSLLAADLVARMSQELGERISLAEFLVNPTPQGLVDLIHHTSRPGHASIALVRSTEDGPHPLTAAQSDILMREQLTRDDTAYVIPGAVVFTGVVDEELLLRSLDLLRRRHGALRTVFGFDEDGKPVQDVLAGDAEWCVESLDLTTSDAISPESLVESIMHRTPFDLSKSPFYAAVGRRDPESVLVVAIVHHIVSDGWSMTTLLADLLMIYQSLVDGTDPTPTVHEVELTDVARWEQASCDSPETERRRNYWVSAAQSWNIAAVPHDLRADPTATNRPAGIVRNITIAKSMVDAVRERNGATAFMVLAAAWAAALARLTAEGEIVTAVPLGHRSDPAVDGLVGLLVETLPLHIRTGRNGDLDTIVRATKASLLGAQAHITPGVGRLLGAKGACNTMVVMRTPLPAIEMEGFRIEPVDTHPAHAKFDLTAFFDEQFDHYRLTLEYAADAFLPASAERIAKDVVQIVERSAGMSTTTPARVLEATVPADLLRTIEVTG